MTFIRKLTLAAALATALSACAQAPVAPPSDWAAKMDQHVSAMRDMHEKMMGASTTKERDALMADQMKLMRDGMGVMSEMAGSDPGSMGCKAGMGGMHMGGMAGKAGMGGMDMGAKQCGAEQQCGASASGGMMMCPQVIEKRLEMMQHMMQMMMDRMAAVPAMK